MVGFGDHLSFEDLSRLASRDVNQNTTPRNDPYHASISVDVPSERIHDHHSHIGIEKLLSVPVTKDMLIKDVRSKMLQSAKATYAKWLEDSLIGANQSFDLKEATDEVNPHNQCNLNI